MNTTKSWNKCSLNRNRALTGLLVVAGWLLGVGQVWAQVASGQSSGSAQSPGGDSVVQIVADMASLSAVPPSEVPKYATFWLAIPAAGPNGILALPLPFPPADPNQTVFAITPDGQQFLVDGTANQTFPTTAHVGRTVSSATAASVAQAQINTLLALVNQIQGINAAQGTAARFGIAHPDSPGGGSGGGDGISNSYSYTINSNLLWIQITNICDGIVYANLFQGTDSVYGVFSTTNLALDFSLWQPETEVWPTDTNCTPFTVATLGRQDLFLRAMDWTGVDSDADGVPDWWDWLYFGGTTMNTGGQDYSGSGYTFAQDYSNNTPPTVFQYTGVMVTNNYVNSSLVPLQLNVAGFPYYIATLVDATNFADGVWNAYSSTNVTAYLGTTEGWHNVWIGLRGHGDAPSSAVWQGQSLNLELTPPAVVITSPASGTVSVSAIQLTGYASEALSSITYEVSNAVQLLTGQTGYITSQFFDTNVLEFTTNYFQCYNVPLAPGANTVAVHATDLAGNTTTVTENYTVDYSTDNTAPVLSILWPPAGASISASSFTVQAQVDDITANVTAAITGANGDSSSVPVTIEQNGTAWAQLPLLAATNTLTLTATDAAGNKSIVSSTLYQSSVMVTVTPLVANQLNQSSVDVTGTVSDPTDAVVVNGVQAYYVDDAGDWEADGVPVSATGTATMIVQVYMGDPVLLGQVSVNQAQPATVALADWSQVLSFQDPWSDENTSVGWDSQVGGSYNYWGTITGEEYPFASHSYNVTGPLSTNLVLPPAWECAAFNESISGWEVDNATQSKVVIIPPGQGQLGTTNLYLVYASAMNFSYVSFRYSGQPVEFSYYEAAGDLALPPEWLQIQHHTLVNSGITNTDGSVWGCTLISAAAAASPDVTPLAMQVYGVNDYTFNVQALDVTHVWAVDANRDGTIAFDGTHQTSASRPYRFWVNDASESGDISTAANAVPGASSPNCALNNVNGRSDLVNFIPVALNLSSIMQLMPPTNGWEYHLSQADSAVKFVYTSLTTGNAFDYLTDATNSSGYGVNTNEAAYAADTVQVSPSGASGTVLDTNWLAMVQSNGGNGVVLMEGCTTSTAPLVLELWRRDQNGVDHELGGVPLYLSLSEVEQMYRWVNLRHVTGETETRATDTSQPANYPDSTSDGKQFVFVHGYNVNESQARGWSAEIFKRLYQSGSHAMFTAVTWYGEEGQWPVFGITPDYYENVVNAFDTASNLASVVNSLPGQKYIAGHSLGNMVVSSAVVDWGLNVNAYIMIDAAVAMEAYDAGVGINMNLVPTPFWPNYHTNLWASEWFSLFTNDSRTNLTWRGRFGNIPNAYNYYSSTENVLADADAPHNVLTISLRARNQQFAWVNQEMLKGSWASAIITVFSESEAGWGLGNYSHLSLQDANSLTTAQLQTNSVFESFDDTVLYDINNGSAEAAKPAVREKVLADGIPALSNAAGGTFLGINFGVVNADRNMNSYKGLNMNGLWPRSGDDWEHSDIVSIAYSFNYAVFNQIVTDGGLR